MPAKRRSSSASPIDLARLWAPWRSGYLAKAPAGGCFLCVGKSSVRDRERLVVRRSKTAFVILNRYPYNNGHLMVAPLRHVGSLQSLNAAEWRDLWKLATVFMDRLSATIHPHGFNLGVNVGRAAGAGVPGHLHLHLVPRWNGDTNFMPVMGHAKVIAQSLEELYDLLAARRG